jgi:hypothetical protein
MLVQVPTERDRLLAPSEVARWLHVSPCWVEETGRRAKKWKGHFYVYVCGPDGSERRKHRAVTLGLKAGMKKWDAEKKLMEIIEKETSGGSVQPSPIYTLEWFWQNRYRPLKEPVWKPSSRVHRGRTRLLDGQHAGSPSRSLHL